MMDNNLNLTPELLEKAKSAPSAAALLALAQENGTPMTAEEAATYYAQLHPETGALSDEELDNVSGGCGDGGAKGSDEFQFSFCHGAYRCTWCSQSIDSHLKGHCCSQQPLDCSTCKNFQKGRCIQKTH